ncbi:MAG: ABC transporter permease [Methylicorpusculum sp.]|uniref:ABC transporter permease n=1 Tax=Methylicorpusculum sp. TaxID=2713644 RepID=UPI0027183334|nr:ABC transporter permease [Methylicorpusculum sp.]MDO8846062.1 ABC transporter permease [Methylicorpusculum sp.]MDO8937528.1 ABC transporter permease [Methylicorpusculum sp.]MDP2204625.1 ABC transporter permease [Methylicorpusculum sp.]
MNLALRDIKHNLSRFAFTTVGIGLLLMIVMGMGGIYRGLIFEATLLVNRIGADLWVVQGQTRGPFAENSRIPANLEDRLRALPGVARSRRFVSHSIQREHHGQPLRMMVQGLAWPDDKGEWVSLIAGRALGQAHYEMIADRSLGLALGEHVKFGKDRYRVVGITGGMSGIAGDGLAFFTVSDAMAIQFDLPGEAVRLERAARFARSEKQDLGRTQPLSLERAAGPASTLSELAPPQVSAILVTLQPGANLDHTLNLLSAWPDITVHTAQQQRALLLSGTVDKSKRQLGLFSVLLIIISTIIIALIMYTLTLDKIHDIAMLKLIGARNRVIIGLILQQALLMGMLGYGLAWWLGQYLFPYFPRRVLLESPDLVKLAFITVAISVLASLLGIWKALRVEPNSVLA